MNKNSLYEKIGEAVVNPNWELSTNLNERSEIKIIVNQEQIAQFIARVQSKLAGSYYKGAVYTGKQDNTHN